MLCLCVAALAFTVGSMSGFDTRPTRACVHVRTGTTDPQAYRLPEHADIAITTRTFPPSTRCVWPDGTSVELVPPWANPLLLISLVGVVAFVGGAVRASSTRQRPHSETQP